MTFSELFNILCLVITATISGLNIYIGFETEGKEGGKYLAKGFFFLVIGLILFFKLITEGKV